MNKKINKPLADQMQAELVGVIRDLLRAWAKGEDCGEFGTHPAVVRANAAVNKAKGDG